MNSVRKSQNCQRLKKDASHSANLSRGFFTTTPHPSQKYYSKSGRGDVKANHDVAVFVDFDKINELHIGIDSCFRVLQENSFSLQHGMMDRNRFSIETMVLGIESCRMFDEKQTATGGKHSLDTSGEHELPDAKRKLDYDVAEDLRNGRLVNMDRLSDFGNTARNAVNNAESDTFTADNVNNEEPNPTSATDGVENQGHVHIEQREGTACPYTTETPSTKAARHIRQGDQFSLTQMRKMQLCKRTVFYSMKLTSPTLSIE